MKVSELEGTLLDYWVARAAELALCDEWDCSAYGGILIGTGEGDLTPFSPSSDWSDGGPIIEREQIQLWPPTHPHHSSWGATSKELEVKTAGIGAPKYGQTPLIAAMRAYVASKFGEEIKESQ